MCQATAKTKPFRCYCKQTRPIVAAEIVAFHAAIKIIPDCIETLFDTGLLENLFLFHSYRDNLLQTTSLINFRGFFDANFMTPFFALEIAKLATYCFI